MPLRGQGGSGCVLDAVRGALGGHSHGSGELTPNHIEKHRILQERGALIVEAVDVLARLRSTASN